MRVQRVLYDMCCITGTTDTVKVEIWDTVDKGKETGWAGIVWPEHESISEIEQGEAVHSSIFYNLFVTST